MPSVVSSMNFGRDRARNVALVPLLSMCALLAAGCGSTKVYTPDKTVVYDDAEIVYEQGTLAKGREFSRMQDNLSEVQKKLTRFMGDGKKTQLKL